MIKISPSILAADFSRLAEEVRKVEAGGADLLHIDVMDGHFVPNLTFGPPVVASVRKAAGLPFDVHLMIDQPDRFIGDFAAAGADILTFHYEAQPDAEPLIARIRRSGVLPGISIKPGTPPQVLFPLLDRLSMVLVMTVEPGFGGQAFMPECLAKIAVLRRECERRGLSTDIEVDGGISTATAGAVVRAGANVLVAGSAIFHSAEPGKAIGELRAAAQAAVQ